MRGACRIVYTWQGHGQLGWGARIELAVGQRQPLRASRWRGHETSGLFDASGTQLAGRLLDIAGCETYVVDAPAQSSSSLPPVVLLHGYGDTADAGAG